MAAAKALHEHTDFDAETIAKHAMSIAASIDIYTNDQFVIETLEV